MYTGVTNGSQFWAVKRFSLYSFQTASANRAARAGS